MFYWVILGYVGFYWVILVYTGLKGIWFNRAFIG